MGLANFNVCVLLEFIERLYAGIDGFIVCVLLEFVER
jgi:heme A synthase